MLEFLCTSEGKRGLECVKGETGTEGRERRKKKREERERERGGSKGEESVVVVLVCTA